MPDRRNVPTKVMVFQCPCGSQALATERPAANFGHFGAGGRLAQENGGRRIKVDLAVKPELSRFLDIWAGLFGCVRYLF
jgi:hypothetical protein